MTWLPARRGAARRRATLALAALALLLLALAPRHTEALTLSLTASDCGGIGSAFTALNAALAGATRPSAVSLKLTLACSGTFNSCAGDYRLNYATPSLVGSKQPKVGVTIGAASACRTGSARPKVTTGAGLLFVADDNQRPDTASLAFRIQDLILQSDSPPAYGVALYAKPTQTLTVTITNVAFQSSSLQVTNANTATITSSDFANGQAGGAAVSVRKAAAVSRCNFEGCAASVWGGGLSLILFEGAKGTVAQSYFASNTAGSHGNALLLLTETFSSTLAVTGCTFGSNAGPAPQTICVRSGEPGTPPARFLKITGTTGLVSPLTAPWDTTASCTVASIM